MNHDEYRRIRSTFAQARDIDPRLVAELRRITSRLVRFRGLPPSYAPYGVWNEEAEEEIFQSWATERLVRGQLQALLDRAANLESFGRLAERSLRQHVLNQRERSQAQNLYWRSAELLDSDPDFERFIDAARPQDVWWGLAVWAEEPRPQFSGDDARLLAEAWALGDFELIRYRPDARKLSPLLSTPELKRFLCSLLERVQALLTLSRIMRALERRFNLGEIQLGTIETPEAEAAAAVEPDEIVLEETALAAIAEMTARQVEVLVGTDARETIDDMSERLSCSVGTVVNEQRRVAGILDRHSEDGDQRAVMLRKVLDLLYEENQRR